MNQTNELLSPYNALKNTMYRISHQLRGATLTVNYSDVGIQVERDVEGPHAGKDKFFKTRAITINGTQWLIGALAPDFRNQNSYSFAYGFPYNWTEIFTRTLAGSVPRVMPPEPPHVNYLVQSFSEINAYILNENGVLNISKNNEGTFRRNDTKEAIRSSMCSIEGKIYYRPDLPSRLAPLFYDALVKMQTSTIDRKRH